MDALLPNQQLHLAKEPRVSCIAMQRVVDANTHLCGVDCTL